MQHRSIVWYGIAGGSPTDFIEWVGEPNWAGSRQVQFLGVCFPNPGCLALYLYLYLYLYFYSGLVNPTRLGLAAAGIALMSQTALQPSRPHLDFFELFSLNYFLSIIFFQLFSLNYFPSIIFFQLFSLNYFLWIIFFQLFVYLLAHFYVNYLLMRYFLQY